MKLETDLNEIKKLAKEKEDENWNFRTFLKGFDAPIEEIDAIVHRLNRQVSAEIDCKKCANCCKQISPLFNQNDIKRFVRGLALRAEELKSSFLQKDEETGKYIFKVHPCPFLKDNLCTNYENRPADCRSFPHLH